MWITFSGSNLGPPKRIPAVAFRVFGGRISVIYLEDPSQDMQVETGSPPIFWPFISFTGDLEGEGVTITVVLNHESLRTGSPSSNQGQLAKYRI